MESIIDRFEGDKVILEIEEKVSVFNRELFPINAKEGDIVEYIDNKFIIKEEETKKRKEYIDNLFKTLADKEDN